MYTGGCQSESMILWQTQTLYVINASIMMRPFLDQLCHRVSEPAGRVLSASPVLTACDCTSVY